MLNTGHNVVVVYVNYNTSEQVAESIESLDFDGPMTIVVVDNASPDDDLSTLRQARSDIVVIELAENVGFGGGCNVGLHWLQRNAACDFVFFLNPDTKVTPGAIDRLLANFGNPSVGVACPRIITSSTPPTLWYGGGSISWWKGSADVPGYGGVIDAPSAQQGRYVEFATGCACMVRRDVLDRCGGFDERYFMYEEDVEFSLRVRRAGYEIYYEPTALVIHIGQGSQEPRARSIGMYHPSNPRLTFFVYHVVRNRCLTAALHLPRRERLKFAIGFTAWLLKKNIVWIVRGRMDAVHSAWRGLVAGRHAVKDLR